MKTNKFKKPCKKFMQDYREYSRLSAAKELGRLRPDINPLVVGRWGFSAALAFDLLDAITHDTGDMKVQGRINLRGNAERTLGKVVWNSRKLELNKYWLAFSKG